MRAPHLPDSRTMSAARHICHPARLLLGCALACTLLCSTQPAVARDGLGIFGSWAAFRDPAVPRCYAIAMAQPSPFARTFQPYAVIGTWPRRGARGQLHLRLSRRTAPQARVILRIGAQHFILVAGQADAWAADSSADAAIVAAMRSATAMTVSSRDDHGRPFGNTYDLAGAATAMDTATLACARL